jgi:phycocyanobilin:ferredoxin oxidoreductase
MCSDAGQKMEIVRAAHVRYCEKQQENSKTSRVLQSAFGEEFAKRYMSEIMFDPPGQLQAQAAATP